MAKIIEIKNCADCPLSDIKGRGKVYCDSFAVVMRHRKERFCGTLKDVTERNIIPDFCPLTDLNEFLREIELIKKQKLPEKTANGYNSDEVISALQKDIRRGNTERACYWAYELLSSGEALQNKFWERMVVISVEDVGMANPQAICVINSLREAYQILNRDKGDAKLLGIFATYYLSKQKKNRTIDDMYNCFKRGLIEKPSIPDYAYDKHTKKGKEMGRGLVHFYKYGAVIKNVNKDYDREYLKKILRWLNEQER